MSPVNLKQLVSEAGWVYSGRQEFIEIIGDDMRLATLKQLVSEAGWVDVPRFKYCFYVGASIYRPSLKYLVNARVFIVTKPFNRSTKAQEYNIFWCQLTTCLESLVDLS